MPVLLISIRFYDGRYHGSGVWPPSPARVFQGLVAGSARGENLCDHALEALKWLESLDAPAIVVPPGYAGQSFKNFVPNNDRDIVEAKRLRGSFESEAEYQRDIAKQRTGKTVRPRTFNAAVPLLYAWRFDSSTDAERHARTICQIADDLYQLGRGVDMAWATGEVVDKADAHFRANGGVQWHPTRGGDGAELSCPRTGSLASLAKRFKETRRRFKTVTEGKKISQLFAQASKPDFRQVRYNSPSVFLLFEIRNVDGFAPQPFERAVKLTENVRDLAVKRLKTSTWRRDDPKREALADKIFVGRQSQEADKSRRIHIAPLPSIGYAHTERSIRRVLVAVPPDCPIAIGDVAWTFSGLVLEFDHETGEIPKDAAMLVSADDDSMLAHYGVPKGGESRRWRTVTPVVLPVSAAWRRINSGRIRKDPKVGTERLKEQAAAEWAVKQALRHADVPTPVQSIRVQREPFEAGGELAESFADGHRFVKERLWHVEITFAEGRCGPLIIGDGRYLGLGLMAPVKDRFQDAFTFQVRSDVRLPFGAQSAIVEAVRRALMSRERDANGGKVSVLFSGHGNEPGPARSGRHEHVYLCVDGSRDRDIVDRLYVVAPWRVDRSWRLDSRNENRRLFETVVAGLQTVRAGSAGILTLDPLSGAEYDEPVFRSARNWVSRTPYRPTRHAKRNQDMAAFAASDLLCECLRRSLPRPEITIEEIMNGPRGGASVRARLQFKVAVAGPILLGRDAHSGGGLFVPEG